MRIHQCFLLIVLCLAAPVSAIAAHNPLLPRPQQINYGVGHLAVRGLAIEFASPPSPEDRFAAQELSKWLGSRAGAEIPVAENKESGPAIVLERTGAVDALPVPGEKPGPDSREAFYLVEAGYATIADVDRSLRNDFGYWITFAGPFRYMDLTGIPAYAAVMKDLFPELDCARKVPDLMRKVVKSGAKGVSNARGFYRYAPKEAARWEKQFMKFSYEIRTLAQKYPEAMPKQARGKKRGR